MKKVLAILIAIVICSSLIVVTDALGEPTFTVSSCNANPGDTISVTISVSNNPGLSSLKFSVLFDSILELETVEYNSSFLGQTMQPKNLSSPVTLIWISPFSNVHTDGVFATHFTYGKFIARCNPTCMFFETNKRKCGNRSNSIRRKKVSTLFTNVKHLPTFFFTC